MRYQIFSLQQSSLVELGLNVEEALLLDWILNWKDGTGMKREFIEEQQDILKAIIEVSKDLLNHIESKGENK